MKKLLVKLTAVAIILGLGFGAVHDVKIDKNAAETTVNSPKGDPGSGPRPD